MKKDIFKEIESSSPFSEDALREIAKEKVLWYLGVKIHALVFALINPMLFIVNLLTTGFSIIWFVYPLAGWIIALGTHFTAYYLYSRGITGGTKKSFIIHAVETALIPGSLYIINYFSSSFYYWFLWPTSGLVLSLLIHLIILRWFVKEPDDEHAARSWLEKKIDEELKKAKEKSEIKGG
ncbi:MAG: 2TM domain-containing protein [Promethearchaeota archaeon]